VYPVQFEKELEQAIEAIGREPTELELVLLESFWKEHFNLKSGTQSLHLLQGAIPDFNLELCSRADGTSITAALDVAISVEALNPADRKVGCQDESTIVGSVARNLAAKGFTPMMLANIFRKREPLDLESLESLRNSVLKTSRYSNMIGIPTLGGELQFDRSYFGNGVLNFACVGVRRNGKRKRIVPSEGHLVVLMNSSLWMKKSTSGVSLSDSPDTSESDKTSDLAILDAMATRSLLDALEKLNGQGIVIASENVGCGGLASAFGKIAVHNETGLVIQVEMLDQLSNGPMNNVIQSTSEPGIVLVIDESSLEPASSIGESFDTRLHSVGRITSDEFYTITERDEEKARLPLSVLTECCPAILRIEAELPSQDTSLAWLEEPEDFHPIIKEILGSINICSRSWIYGQFDQHVGIRTVVDIGENAGVLEGSGSQLLALATDCNSYWCLLDPLHGAANSASESLRNLVSMGAKPLLMGSALNFGNPEKSESYALYAEAVRGIGQFSHDFKIPMGDMALSMFNEQKRDGKLERINPTPQVFMIGSFAQGVKPSRRALCTPLANIFLLGSTHGDLNGSEFQRMHLGRVEGLPPRYRPEDEKNAMNAMLEAHSKRMIRACNNVGRGGIAVALLKMVVNSSYGFKVDLLDVPGTARSLTQVLFSETSARYLAEVTESNQEEFLGIMEKHKVPFDELGLTMTEPIARFGKFSIPVDEARAIFEGGLQRFSSGPT
jgi:phosphoribosylformylglycinamidine synthase